MLDIDYFKRVNDEHGHLVGDRVLAVLSDYVRASIRSSDVFGRWGGEEFLVICPETSLAQAQTVAEKVRSSIEQASFPIPEKVTVSIGVSGCSPEDKAETLVASADKALYRSKKAGRNCVSV
jgi:diguanylate cyclase (GGDEF)-like protein